ncbi:MAG: ferrous iron transport protein A [Oligosphaeraceae bacterium]
MSKNQCPCCCGGSGKPRSYSSSAFPGFSGDSGEGPLSQLPLGACGEITGMPSALRSRQKLADVGLIPGICVEMEAHAPFGSLCRIGLLGTSLAISMEDASQIRVRVVERQEGGES